MQKGKCKNCGADESIHHYQTLRCPVGGVEAPVGKPDEWMDCIFETEEEDGFFKNCVSKPGKYFTCGFTIINREAVAFVQGNINLGVFGYRVEFIGGQSLNLYDEDAHEFIAWLLGEEA